MNERAQELHNVIEKLIALGEDATELHFWESIVDDLSQEEYDALLASLTKEIAELSASASLKRPPAPRE
jgi:hypothetical protein